MIDINEINANKDVEVICNPSVGDTLKELLRKEAISTVRLVDVPEIGNTIKLAFTNGSELELHYSEGIKINGVQAVDNDDLYNKLKAIFPL